MTVKVAVNKELENQRNAKVIGGNLQAQVTLYADTALAEKLNRLGDELRFVLITSTAQVADLAAAPADAAELPETQPRAMPNASQGRAPVELAPFDPVWQAMVMPADDAPMAPPPMRSMPVAAASASNDEMNSVEEAIFLAQGIQALPPEGISLKQHLVDIERSLIEQALSRTQGNVSRTAKLLQLQRTTLIEKINKYELRAGG